MPFHSSLKICRCLLFNPRQIILGGQRSDLETMGGGNSLLTESADKCSARMNAGGWWLVDAQPAEEVGGGIIKGWAGSVSGIRIEGKQEENTKKG